MGSGRKVIIAHFTELGQCGNNFKDDEAFMDTVEIPTEMGLSGNAGPLGTNPIAVIATPLAALLSTNKLLYPEKIDELEDIIRGQLPGVNVDLAKVGYKKFFAGANAFDGNAGKVVVQWIAPQDRTPPSPDIGELNIYVEDDNPKLQARYNAQGGRQP